jgi:hypothetical protein
MPGATICASRENKQRDSGLLSEIAMCSHQNLSILDTALSHEGPTLSCHDKGSSKVAPSLLFVLMAGIQHTPQLLQCLVAQGISMIDPVRAATSMLAWSDSVASRRPSKP